MEEYSDFTNKCGMFACDNIWIMASDENAKAYRWHNKYSLLTTKVWGKLACLCSRWYWELVLPRVAGSKWRPSSLVSRSILASTRPRSKLCTVSTDTCTGADDQAICDWQVLGRWGLCFNEIKESLVEETVQPVRILRLWHEMWELRPRRLDLKVIRSWKHV